MLRILVVAITVSLVISGGSSYYLREMLSDEVAETRRQATSQVRRVEANAAEADRDIVEQTDAIEENMVSYANEFRGHRSQYMSDKEQSTEEVNAIKNLLEALGSESSEIFSMLEKNLQRLESSEDLISSLQEVMAEFNTELSRLETEVEELTLIATPATDSYYDDLAKVDACSVVPVNTDEQTGPLQEAMEQSSSSGLHNVVVRFDITEQGDTVLQEMESTTAPSRLMSAVGRYVNGLRFNQREALLTDCEMIVRLDIDNPRY